MGRVTGHYRRLPHSRKRHLVSGYTRKVRKHRGKYKKHRRRR